MPRGTGGSICALVRGTGIGWPRLSLAALAHCVERLGLTVAALVLSRRGAGWAVPVTVGVGGLFILRAAVRSALRLRVRGRLLESLAAALLVDPLVGSDGGEADTEMSLFNGMQAAEDVLGSRIPDLLGDLPACIALAGLLLRVEPRELVLEGGIAVAAGATAVFLVRRITSHSAQLVWEALMPAVDDLSTAIHGRLEIVGNGDDASFLRDLSRKVKEWESRSRGAARVSFFAGRAPVVAAAAIVCLFLVRQGGWGSDDLASAAVIASVTPAFAGVARGVLDLARDLVRAQPVVDCFSETRVGALHGVIVPAERAAITWEDVSFSYPGQVIPALDRVSLAWSANELLGLAGRNGSGKSTFTRLLLALHPPTGGRITVAGTPLTDVDGPKFRRRLGFLAQRPFLPDHTTVTQAVQLLAPEASSSLVEAMLMRLDVWPTLVRQRGSRPLDVKLGALSAGEKQRVAIARVLLRDAEILVLDEPDANLDADGIALVARILREESQKRMVIFVAHNPVLLAAADRVIHFEAGHVRHLQET